ncbi:signal peptidase I [Candidatus Woesearchaeota archaeon]|nr:signal peptidase I [Candidatus Woesearchaeota archaeon]
MEKRRLRETGRKIWHFLWEEDSLGSWIANIILAFVLIKFVVYPVLGFLLNTSFPIVAVVSGSMEHRMASDEAGPLSLCGQWFKAEQPVDFNKYWEICGWWYEKNTVIGKDDFKEFQFSSGFNKGDIMVLYGKDPKDIRVGDVIVFKSRRPDPIIHRVVKVTQEEGTYYFQTKGDHNEKVIKSPMLDESKIPQDQVLGNAVFRVPFLGYIKIWFVELIGLFTR